MHHAIATVAARACVFSFFLIRPSMFHDAKSMWAFGVYRRERTSLFCTAALTKKRPQGRLF
jgi:hypothetical protein